MYDVGTLVRTRGARRNGHTRLPRYLERRRGRIVAVLGAFRFADDAAEHGLRAPKQMLYTVEFDAPGHRIHADLFESYLERDA